ncbi:MAG: endopeptidase La [Proteobacteria bacterium]|nr:MAG: endopeptidase La [Pseudomonadota bacterium]
MDVKLESNTSPTDSAAAPSAESAAAVPALPDDALIIVPVRNLILFPGMILPLNIGREQSITAAQYAVRNERPVGLLLQKDPAVDRPGSEDVVRVGTVAQVLRYVTTPDGGHHLICQGQERFIVHEFLSGYPFLVARVERIADGSYSSQDIEARFLQLKKRAAEALELLPQTPQELASAVQNFTSPGGLADMVTGFMDLKPEEKQRILETFNLQTRLDAVLDLLAHRIEVLKISKEIDDKTKANVDERQREFMLREQMKAIQQELGEGESENDAEDLAKAIAEAGMPDEIEKHATKELKRLQRMPESSAEYSMARTYLEWLIELPWKITTETTIDLAEARRILDNDHFGLEKIKKRILEFLAVRKLNPQGHSPILCFVGPPGVGKTSLGQSIAKALGRKFVRVALGGVHDEAEIRGHRRTYVGALPGNIIQAIKKASSRDCVMMLDEIDKLGQGFHGDPSSALLEVLDPEQNSTFRDSYLGVPFDLSRVTFIATANMLDTIPGPLRDRMEVIQLPGYTEEEKLQIAKKYLVGRQLERNGLGPEKLDITDQALKSIIHDYTREAGVRQLEREIGAVVRSAAVKIAEGSLDKVRVDAGDLIDILGPARFEGEVAQRTSVPGVATGLAWTPVGGDILFIEASRTPGGGKLILTGQLGEVMKESAQAALTLVKSRAESLGIDVTPLERSDVHVHVPAGAIPKDGPSAGVAMFMALASLMSNRAVRNDTAMTGEISLRGLVLPIGGVKEKVLAAMRAGITTVMLPRRNEKDLRDVPEDARRSMRFVLLDTVDDAVRTALVEPQRVAEVALAD